MNALPEMLHLLKTASNATDMSVLQRQQAQMNWQQQPQQSYFSGNDQINIFSTQDAEVIQFQPADSVFGRFMNRAVKPDPGMETEWPDYGNHLGYGACEYGNVNGIELNYAISRTTSCPPAVVAAAIAKGASSDTKGKEQSFPEKSCTMGRESFKKRKADKNDNQKVTEEEGIKDKRIKGSDEETDSKIKLYQNNNKSSMKQNNSDDKETSNDTSKEKSKISEVQKPDYIHVRARRGQATDSHSLAERVRREKISERMKYLQDLVPGCNKITGKAGMLDEIINYVQSLQRQVEFLSMKLATVNPRLDFNIDNLFRKEMIPACTSNFPTIGLSSEIANPAYSQFNPLQQAVTCCGIDLEINPLDMALKRTTSAPVSIAETFVNPSYFNQMQHSSTWDAELQNLYNVEFQLQQGRSTAYSPQLFSDSIEGNNLKMEM